MGRNPAHGVGVQLGRRTFYGAMKRDPELKTALDQARAHGCATLRRLHLASALPATVGVTTNWRFVGPIASLPWNQNNPACHEQVRVYHEKLQVALDAQRAAAEQARIKGQQRARAAQQELQQALEAYPECHGQLHNFSEIINANPYRTTGVCYLMQPQPVTQWRSATPKVRVA